jgi:hypothetical protein
MGRRAQEKRARLPGNHSLLGKPLNLSSRKMTRNAGRSLSLCHLSTKLRTGRLLAIAFRTLVSDQSCSAARGAVVTTSSPRTTLN